MDAKFRLIEYVATIGIDDSVRESIKRMDGGNVSSIMELPLEGCVLNRFPLEEHKDFPFPAGIESFCLPNGWHIETAPKRPVFYSVVLTDVGGIYSYAAYIVWNQYIGKYNNDKNVETEVYTPKCICVVSRLPYFEKFKECLLTIFDGLSKQKNLNKSADLFLTEKVVSALISSPQIFEPGLEPYHLTLYDKYFINVSPPLTTQFNTTGDDAFFLAKHLGVHNLIRLYSVLLLDNKILFVSSSYNFLFKACNGLVALLYPLKFNYIYIPLLPKSLIDIVNAPTPFMIGMHASSFEIYGADNLGNDVVVVNLDTGSVEIPTDYHLPNLPDDMRHFLEVGISNILFPELNSPDELFCELEQMSHEEKDKKIRAYFLVLLVQMFQGYLSCINIVKVHPKILIKFQKDQFLFRRNLCDCQFILKLLDTMIFHQFVSERGVPYRRSDIFDDLMMRYNNEVADNKERTNLTQFIKTAWLAFMENERVDEVGDKHHSSCIPKIEAYEESKFSKLKVRDIETKKVTFNTTQPSPPKLRHSTNLLAKMARIPSCIPLDINSYQFGLSYSVSVIHCNILKEFVRYIFEGECPRALQMITKVQSLGVQPGIRVLLCNELNNKMMGNYDQLDCEQFRILCDVLNSYLDYENDNYCFIMSSLVVELANHFYKKNKDNLVYIYTQLHNHKAWGFLPFWETIFYVGAQTQLNFLYLQNKTLASIQPVFKEKTFSSYYANENKTKNETADQMTILHPRYQDVSRVTPVIVDQLMKLPKLSADNLEIVEKLEYDILFSTISLFISKILYMNMQMKEASKYLRNFPSIPSGNKLEERLSVVDTLKSNAGIRNESNTLGRRTNTLTVISHKSICELIQRFISNVIVMLDFNFKVSTQIEAHMSEIMKFHCEALDRIYHEKEVLLKDINEVVKAPLKIPGETVNCVFSCVLLPDGSTNNIHNVSEDSPAILPALGVVYMTQYQLQFWGYPISRYTSNQIVFRSIPLGLIRSSKAAEIGFYPSIYQKTTTLSQVILILLKTGGRVIFGLLPENSSEKNDLFSKLLNKRYARLLVSLSQTEHLTMDPAESATWMVGAGSSDKIDQSNTPTLTTQSTNDFFRRDSIVSNFDIDSVSVFEGGTDTIGFNKVSKVNMFKSNMKSKFKGFKKSATKRLKSAPINVESSMPTKSKQKPKVLTAADFKAIYTQYFEGDANNEETVNNKFADKSLFVADYARRMWILVIDCTLANNLFSKMDWRLSLLNINRIIPTLPPLFPVCFQITDEIIMRLTKMFKSKRIPILTWIRTKSTATATTSDFNYYPGALLRCGSVLKSLNVFGYKTGTLSSNAKTNVNNGLNELDNYFITLAGISAKAKVMQVVKTPKASIDQVGTSLSLEMYLDMVDRLQRPHMLFLTDTQEAYDVNDVSCHYSDLFIFGDKSFNKGVSEDKKLAIFNVDLPDANHLESAFLKLTKCLSPNKPDDITQAFFMPLIAKSKWLNYVKKIIMLSNNILFTIDYGESFSVAGFGDGAETSAQISSLVQILLDPYYRTIEGFQTLIEKEWLAFRYNFVVRNGITSGSQSVFYPIFLQFLDCVHQLLLQFPNAFEFNDYFLKFLAYHHLSNKFNTFLTCSTDSFTTDSGKTEDQPDNLDISSELFSAKSSQELSMSTLTKSRSIELLNEEFINEEQMESSEKSQKVGSELIPIAEADSVAESSITINPTATLRSSVSSLPLEYDEYFVKETIWSYINRFHTKIPIFCNTQYIKGMHSVLYPSYHLAVIDLWEFYYETPQMMTPSNYELEYIDTNLFANSNAVFPYEVFCTNNVVSYSALNSEAESAMKEVPLASQNFTFYSGAPYLGYIINGPLVVDRFNLIINNYLNNQPEGAKVNSMLEFANVYKSDKLPRTLNVGSFNEQTVLEILHSNYFSIINTKRYFISFVSKDKSFYSKTTLNDSDHYFSQVTHDFVEAPPSEHMSCKYCSKALSGKSNYYTCQKCELNIHIKCSKQISQVCNMGEFEENITKIDASSFPTKKTKSFLKKYQLLFRNKKCSIETEENHNTRKSVSSKQSCSSSQRPSAHSNSYDSRPLTYSPSDSDFQGYLYNYAENNLTNKRYYVINKKSHKLLQYDKKPSLPNSILVDEYYLSDIENCVISEIKSSPQVVLDKSKVDDSNTQILSSGTDQQPCCVYLEVTFRIRNKPLLLLGKTDADTSSWCSSLSKYIQH